MGIDVLVVLHTHSHLPSYRPLNVPILKSVGGQASTHLPIIPLATTPFSPAAYARMQQARQWMLAKSAHPSPGELRAMCSVLSPIRASASSPGGGPAPPAHASGHPCTPP